MPLSVLYRKPLCYRKQLCQNKGLWEIGGFQTGSLFFMHENKIHTEKKL